MKKQLPLYMNFSEKIRMKINSKITIIIVLFIRGSEIIEKNGC